MKLSEISNNVVPKSVYPTVMEYISITIGLIIMSCGWNWFIIPYNITGGGATGLSALIQYSTGIPVYISYLAMNVVLIVIAIKQLGWAFSIKTIFAVGGEYQCLAGGHCAGDKEDGQGMTKTVNIYRFCVW